MSLATMNASGVGTTLKEKNIHNWDNIIDSCNVQHAESILQELAGYGDNPTQCDLIKYVEILSL